MKKKISTILIAHPRADLYGSDRVMLETIEAFVSRGRQVHVSLPAPGPLVAEIESRGATVHLNRSPVLRKSALRPKGLALLFVETIRSIRPGLRIIKDSGADAVLVNTVTVPLWIFLARVRRLPVICHVHEAEGSAPRWMRRALSIPLLMSHRLIVNSEFSLAVLTSAFSSLRQKSTVVYNAVPGPAAVDHPRSDLHSAPRLLFVGRLSPRKGPAIAIEAVKLLRDGGTDAKLDLVGAVFPGYEWFAEELNDQIARSGLTEHVTMHGFRSDVWPYLNSADIALVPSLVDEPFGNTAVESVLAARPVIVSSTSGLKEAVSGYESAVEVKPGDAVALADAIRDMTTRWPLFRDSAETDAVVATARHSTEKYGSELVRVVDELGGGVGRVSGPTPELIDKTSKGK